MKSISTHEKLFAVGKSGPNATFNLIFLGLRWPWVGEIVGFMIIFIGHVPKTRIPVHIEPKSGTC